jgi:hypothetical protein
MKIAERVDSLEKRARAMVQVRADEDEETYKRITKHFYDDLRAAWERALEEVAFAHVVMRHRDYIKVQDLVRVSALTEQDCQSWRDNFAKCCGLMAGHDESRGRNRAMPEPEDILADVKTLGAWVQDLRDRQKEVQASPRGGPVAVTAEGAADGDPGGGALPKARDQRCSKAFSRWRIATCPAIPVSGKRPQASLKAGSLRR